VEAGGRCREAEVRRHRERHADPDRDAVDPGEDRLLALRPHHEREVVAKIVVLVRRSLLAATVGVTVDAGEIESGAEGVAVAGDRDRPYVVISGGGAQRRDERPDEVLAATRSRAIAGLPVAHR
jgi:hypothetical protein